MAVHILVDDIDLGRIQLRGDVLGNWAAPEYARHQMAVGDLLSFVPGP